MEREVERVHHLCRIRCGDQPAEVFVKVKLSASDGKLRLSFTGVEGPLRSSDARNNRGQIRLDPDEFESFAAGWDAERVARLRGLWARWNLNDMRAGCEHQRAEKWHERPIDPEEPVGAYGLFFAGQSQPTWNMLVWVHRHEHPEGLLCEPCPTCGYRYGTAWLYEEVPEEVLRELASLPPTDVEPAWI